MAPGFGEDDQAVSEAHGISMVVPVDDEGKFTAEVVDWAGVNVFDANPLIIADLKDRGAIHRHETYDHTYPHCWRTDTPIIYRALPSWYVEVTAFRDRMVELNQQVNWVPSNVRDGRFVSPSEDGPDADVIDAAGAFVVPAAIDAHVHFAYLPAEHAHALGGVAGAVDLASPMAYLDAPVDELADANAKFKAVEPPSVESSRRKKSPVGSSPPVSWPW